MISERRSGSCVGVDQCEVARLNDEGVVWVVDVVDVAQVEAALCLLELPVGSAECEDAELERGVDFLEEFFSVHEVVQSAYSSVSGCVAEEFGGGVVGVDSGWG